MIKVMSDANDSNNVVTLIITKIQIHVRCVYMYGGVSGKCAFAHPSVSESVKLFAYNCTHIVCENVYILVCLHACKCSLFRILYQ